jgi:hypothetical protein
VILPQPCALDDCPAHALLPTRAEEVPQELAAFLGQNALDDAEAVVERQRAGVEEDRTAPAFGSGAPNTTLPMRAWTIAPTHIRHGSTVA